MWTTTELLRLLAASQFAVLAALLFRDYRRDHSAVASVALIAAAVCHIVQPLVEAAGWTPLVHAVVLGGLAVSPAFWILTRVHFDDDCCLSPAVWAALSGFVALGYVAWLAETPPAAAAWPLVGAHAAWWNLAHRLLTLALVAHALVHVYAGSRADLVVTRLRLRYWMLGLCGGYVLVERTARAVSDGTASQAVVDNVYAVSVFLLAFGILVASTLVQPGVLKPSRPPAPAEPAVDPQLADRLRHLVEVKHVYREEGLTITALAARLGAHEYKVRQLVNAQLGFKNFNAFLHHYRIEEAQCLLADPGRRHLTVAQVAFEVGYSSLGPFNRAFKTATGVTPTEFRATRQAETEAVQPPVLPPTLAGSRPAA